MVVFNHLPSSKKRPTPLRPEDYDHEIFLVNVATRSASTGASETRSSSNQSRTAHEDSPERTIRKNSGEHRRRRTQLRNEVARRRYAHYQEREEDSKHLRHQQSAAIHGSTASKSGDNDDDDEGDEEPRGRPISASTIKSRRTKPPPEDAIDILYENERGGFLCGIPLFSSKALGAADLAPWTYSNFKPSATDITNAQPPDPTWEWASPEWQINHDEGTDEDGWEYSFMFSKKFSWHGPKWYCSYVRRRAWVRKRVKKDLGYKAPMEAHMLNSEYLTIHPNQLRGDSVSLSRSGSVRDSRYSAKSIARKEREEAMNFEEISDIGHLMRSLKFCRIDREKTEAVESFVRHGEDDLYYLKERMRDIMSAFVFQASRKYLLSHLSEQFEKATASRKEDDADTNSEDDFGRRIGYLKAAITAADEEVKRLEFWSDIKMMAEEGETKGAVDEEKGWGEEWAGLDNSMPRDVISERKLPGFGDHDEKHILEDDEDSSDTASLSNVEHKTATKGNQKECATKSASIDSDDQDKSRDKGKGRDLE